MEDINGNEDLGHFSEYGLSFDYVEPGTFTDQDEGYYRFQMSWGGPADEFRFYADGTIEYWFLDWFDGAYRDVTSYAEAKWLENEFEIMGLME